MKKIKVIILMIIMCFVFVAPLKTVDAADYISNEFNGNHIFIFHDHVRVIDHIHRVKFEIRIVIHKIIKLAGSH